MFKLAKTQTFAHKVKINTPINGGYEPEALTCTFRLLTTDQVAEYDLDSNSGTREFLNAAVVCIDDLTDAAGQALPYSDEVRDHLFSLPHVRRALVKAYADAVSNDAKSGN